MELDTKLRHFKRLFALDQIVCDLTRKYLRGLYESMREHCNYPDEHQTLGSVAEGSMLTRNFCHDPDDASKDFSCLKLEHDVELVAITMSSEIMHEHADSNIVEALDGKAGYVRFNYNHNIIKALVDELMQRINSTHFQKNKLSSRDLVDDCGYMSSFTPRRYLRQLSEDDYTLSGIRNVLEHLYLQDVLEVTHPESNRCLTQASCVQRFEVFYQKKMALQVAYDNVIAVKIPSEFLGDGNPVATWLHRVRNNLSRRQLDEMLRLTSSVNVIAKPSASVLPNEASTEWRISFASIEQRLALWRSNQQDFVYFIFKSIFYRHLKPIDIANLKSYICKTSMLWLCDEFPSNHNLWAESTEGTLKALVHLSAFLMRALEGKSLSYYFIPEINIIKDLPDDTRLKALRKLEEIIRNVSSFIPADVDRLCDRIARIPGEIYDIFSASIARKLGFAFNNQNKVNTATCQLTIEKKKRLSLLVQGAFAFLESGFTNHDFLQRNTPLAKELMLQIGRLADVPTSPLWIGLD